MTDDTPATSPYTTAIPSRAIFDNAVSPRMFQCLAVLCMHANRRGVCWPSRKRIAQLMGGDIGEDAVSHLIRRLQTAGYVQVMHRHDTAGRQQSNKYRIVMDGDLAPDRDRYPYEDRLETTNDTEPRPEREKKPRTPRKQPATAPDTLSWPAASDSPHPADPAGELAGPDTQPESEPADDAEAIRHADAICRMAALHWSEQQHKRYANRAERQHAYARSQGYADWEQYITVYARAHSQPTRTEAHA